MYREHYPADMIASCKVIIESGKEINVTVAPGTEKVLNLDYDSNEQKSVEIRSSNMQVLYPPRS